jgi:hypothetical protein
MIVFRSFIVWPPPVAVSLLVASAFATAAAVSHLRLHHRLDPESVGLPHPRRYAGITNDVQADRFRWQS